MREFGYIRSKLEYNYTLNNQIVHKRGQKKRYFAQQQCKIYNDLPLRGHSSLMGGLQLKLRSQLWLREKSGDGGTVLDMGPIAHTGGWDLKMDLGGQVN